MNWQSLYATQRTGKKENSERSNDPVRNSFVRDYDRIIFSSAFRRLQNKTQVFPLPGAIFVHNRLTHSLEVASVGRSLGKAVGERIAALYGNGNEQFTEFYRYELASVIAAACLAHDIGNPPFGHSGEDAIRAFFNELDGADKETLDKYLTPNQWADFRSFEGNSNAFRILTHSYNEPRPGGFGLTYTTLAALVKYPCTSVEGFRKDDIIARKKSGFFDPEIETYTHIAETLGIPRLADGHVYARHPFVYLTEAADDVCYRVIDLEDAHRLRIITTERFMELFLPFFPDGDDRTYPARPYIERKLKEIVDDNQRVQYVRANWIGLMTEKLANVFMDNEAALLAGTLEKDLLKCLPETERKLIDDINKYSYKHIYNYRSVAEIEMAGYHVIGGLLRELVQAVLHPERTKSAKALKIIPAQFPISARRENVYQNVLSVVDFISGMTDLFALDLYRKMTGIAIPDIR